MTEGERRARKRTCERCGRAWLGRVGRVGRPERRDLVRLSRYLTDEMGAWGMLSVEQGRESGRLMGRIRAEVVLSWGGGRD